MIDACMHLVYNIILYQKYAKKWPSQKLLSKIDKRKYPLKIQYLAKNNLRFSGS